MGTRVGEVAAIETRTALTAKAEGERPGCGDAAGPASASRTLLEEGAVALAQGF